MYLSFRWYGSDDPIPLTHIRQIPLMRSIVAALYDVPASQPWSESRLLQLQDEVKAHGMRFDIVESIPVHDDIKLGRPNRDALIAVYQQNIALLGKLGIHTLCYNFMPLFDWLRTELAMPLPDGSNTMAYRHNEIDKMSDPWSADLVAYWPLEDSPDDLKEAYLKQTEDDLWENLCYFLAKIAPTAEDANVKLAIHPDDPPWGIFGLPRIINTEETLARFLTLVDSPNNGLTFCTGSLGANPENNLPQMIRRFEEKIFFVHCRNVEITGEKTFHETSHPDRAANVDLVASIRALHDIGYTGPLRPDHGRMIWDETGIPGYGLYDRALGAMYVQGIWDAL